jgi:hypothetical protein
MTRAPSFFVHKYPGGPGAEPPALATRAALNGKAC